MQKYCAARSESFHEWFGSNIIIKVLKYKFQNNNINKINKWFNDLSVLQTNLRTWTKTFMIFLNFTDLNSI